MFGVFQDAFQTHGGTVPPFALIGGFHKGKNLDCFFGSNRHVSGFKILDNFSQQRFVARVGAQPNVTGLGKNRSAVIVYKVLHRLVDERRSPSWLPTSTAALCMGQAGVTCGGRQQLRPCVPRRAPSVALYAPTRPTHPAFDRSARAPATEQ